jgi:hypothetical protein
MKRTGIIILALAALLFTACEIESKYSIYRVNFVFDKSVHPYIQVNSYGQFICVKRGANAGQYKVTDAMGNTQTVNIPAMQMQTNPFHYGLGGLIIGAKRPRVPAVELAHKCEQGKDHESQAYERDNKYSYGCHRLRDCRL